MSTVTFKRDSTKLSGRGAKLIVKLDGKKMYLKSGEEKTVEVKTGKHKVLFRPARGILFFLALIGFRGGQLKYKFKVADGQDLVVNCGLKRGGVWYEAE